MKHDEIRNGIRNSREPKYGPFRQHFSATGMGWGGLLLQLGWTPPASGPAIPARAVGLFFAVDKEMREAFAHDGDNVHDGCNYFTMSGEAAEDPGMFRYWWNETKDGTPATKTVHEIPVNPPAGPKREVACNCHARPAHDHGSDDHCRLCGAKA